MKKTRWIISLSSVFLILGGCIHDSEQGDVYVTSFEWVVKTFEENDAGFPYYLQEKGEADYAKHTTTYREKIGHAKSEKEYLILVNEWLNYFRKGHIGLFPNLALSEEDKEAKRALYLDEEEVNLSEGEFKHYLDVNRSSLSPMEGVWQLAGYTIGVVRSKNNDKQFDAFIIQADSVYWFPKQKKAVFTLREDGAFDVTFSMLDHSREKTTAQWIGDSKGILAMHGIDKGPKWYWAKISRKHPIHKKKPSFWRLYPANCL